jgi:hypothetical protein
MRHLLLFSMLLLGTCWVMAQNPPNTQPGQSQTNPAYSNPANSGQSDSSATSQGNAGSKQTVEGCLSSSNGNYMLTAKDGTMYQLMGDNSKLSEHVGHEIKVTGMVSSSATGGNAGTMANNAGQQSIQVSSMKHISKTCEGGGGMSH